jgi:anti-sigma factor RsiW
MERVALEFREVIGLFRHSNRMNTPFYRAPPELKVKIRAALRKESKPEILRFCPFRCATGPAAAAISVCLAGIWVWMVTSQGRYQRLIAEAISDHSRSLLADHLLDVRSSEKNVVERWFIGKLDYSPPVVDLTEAGYKLVGGRLDTLEDRWVAAIVYKHQDCTINLFVWPVAKNAIDFDTQFFLGFHLCGWSKSGLNYLIVSELSQSDMEKFEDQLRKGTE